MRPIKFPVAAAVSIIGWATLAAAAPSAEAAVRSGSVAGHVRGACLRRTARSKVAHATSAPRPPHGVCMVQTRVRRAKTRVRRAPAPARSITALVPPSGVTTKAAVLAAGAASTTGAGASAPCANVELTPEAGNLGLIDAAVLCLINRERAQDGEAPLKANSELEAAAEEHSQELISDDYFAHVSPAGVTPVDRIRTTGYIPNSTVGYVIGENLAWGTYGLATPQAIVAAWIASPEHLANILEAQYTETGIGVVPDVPASLGYGAPGATYAQEFGVIIP